MNSPATHPEESCVIRLNGRLADVFPLFGPLREREWAEGWNPRVVWPDTGAIQERMTFLTGHAQDHDDASLWVVSRYDPDQARIEYTVYSANRVRWILICCRESEGGNATEAEITYTYVGASESARTRNARDLESMFKHRLKDWEHAINHYLRTGDRLTHHH